jgi:osmoprotectant transport system substrate-binding protein
VKTSWLVAAVFVTMIGAGCGGSAAPPESMEVEGVRIASFDFSESRLIAELYAQSLEEQGVDVVRLGTVGPREVVAPALEQGRIDLVPEYLGTASSYFGAAADDVADLAAALDVRGLEPLAPAAAEDVNVLVVTEATAGEYGLTKISDLAHVASSFVLGGPVECPDRPLCLGGLQTTYGLEFEAFTPNRNLAITAEALLRGEVDVGVMFSTAAELSSGPFLVLIDDRNLQPAENIVPVARQATIDHWGAALTGTLDRLSSVLTTEELQELNRRVQDDEPLPAVAASWLLSVGLIEA